MNCPNIATNCALSRRHFLRGSGAALALPFLSAMLPAIRVRADEGAPKGDVRRFVAMNASLGFHGPNLFPSKAGRDYELTPYLEKLKAHRDDFTLFSGLSHPNQNGNNGHASEMTWLTSAQRPGLAGFRNSISLDQLIARNFGGVTRLPSLTLSTRSASLSWTSNGVQIPSQNSPSKLFRTLFVAETEEEVAAELQELKRGRSILDAVRDDARALQKSLGSQDLEKLDEYFTSVRELEIRIQQYEQWARRPKPQVNRELPQDVTDRNDVLSRQRLMYEMMALALQTDSTRAITFDLGAMNAVPSNIPGVQSDWHNLSHHGKDEAKIDELEIIEAAEFELFGEFLQRLKGIEEGGVRLLDRTSILFGSNLGNASSHSWRNLPILVAGGGFKHNGYVAHDADENTPLANLFVMLAQHVGVETDHFGSSTAASIQGLNLPV